MITTNRGYDMDESTLTRRTGVDEDDRARAEWTEYWDGNDLVHRGVVITLKKGIVFPFTQENIGG